MGSPLATSVKIHAESKNEIPTAGTAIQCARSRIQWPNSPMIRNAANGRSGMSAYFMMALPFHQVQLFGGDGGLAAVERDDDRQSHGDHHRSEEHTSELQSLAYLVCRLLLEKKKKKTKLQVRTTTIAE